jgi:hypothetical protein
LAYQDSSGYATSPYTTTRDPSQIQKQSPPIQYDQDTGVFKVSMIQPTWLERGATARVYFHARHVKDGAITSWTSGPTIAILDQFGNVVLATYATAGTVTADPSQSGQYYSDVTVNTIAPEGDYIVQWTGTYTPAGGSAALPLQFRRAFRVKVTKGSSKIFFKRTDQL